MQGPVGAARRPRVPHQFHQPVGADVRAGGESESGEQGPRAAGTERQLDVAVPLPSRMVPTGDGIDRAGERPAGPEHADVHVRTLAAHRLQPDWSGTQGQFPRLGGGRPRGSRTPGGTTMSDHRRSPSPQTAPRSQVVLPGQSQPAEGPHDLTGMYLMHHAFRRDLQRFAAAVEGTPVAERRTWSALAERWERFALVLHHHHSVEDADFWPPLLAAADAAGAPAEREVLEAMEDEHEQLDPALDRCRQAFTAMAGHPCDDHRNALEVRLTAVREVLSHHMTHEETEALPLVQRRLTAAQWAACEKAAARGYPTRLVPFLVPWVADGLPAPVLRAFLADAGPVYALLLRVVRPRYARAEGRAFHHAL